MFHNREPPYESEYFGMDSTDLEPEGRHKANASEPQSKQMGTLQFSMFSLFGCGSGLAIVSGARVAPYSWVQG